MANRVKHRKEVGFLCLAILLGIGGAVGESPVTKPVKKSADVFKNLKVLNDTPSDQLLPAMQFITSTLGVHCEYCHVENAFEKDDKKPKQTARQMMQMVEEINNTKFHGQQEITCYSCHRGSPKPLTVPVIAQSAQRLLNKSAPDAPHESLNQPSLEDVIAKYISARGGADAIGGLVSLEERGTFSADSRGFPIEVYRTQSAHSASVIHFPGADRITAFDGVSGWIALPGRPTRTMTSGEVDVARVDANLQFALNLTKIFSEIKLTGMSKVGSEDTVLLSGRRPGLPQVEMYFGVSSGLLLRIVYYSPATLGLNPTQIDYSDYREIRGVKIPFHWTSATPTGQFSVQIESAQANEAIPEKVFSMPAEGKPGL